jgi:hypothetical protein
MDRIGDINRREGKELKKERGMVKKVMILVMTLLLCSTSLWALEIGGINMPDTMKAGNADLILNGAGLRTKFGLKVYGIGLYLKAKSADSSAIVNADEPMALQMKWKMSIPPAKIDETFYESFATVVKAPKQDSYGPKSNYGPLTKDIVTFMGWVDQKPTSKTDPTVYIYIPGKGTEVHVYEGGKDQLKGVIPGVEFKKALFGIWLGEKPPVGESLKNGMLGKK